MNARAIFGLSALTSLIAATTAAYLWVAPRLHKMERNTALLLLVVPHMFFRTIGLSFLIPGVVSPLLPGTFAAPAAYGDFATAWLAIGSAITLAKHKAFAVWLVWIFNIWGSVDLLNAIYQGNMHAIDPGMLGAAFYIPTAIVPPLLVTHGLIFWLLLGTGRTTEPQQKGAAWR